MSNFFNHVRRGFTLVELLIVIIIIAVLAAVAIPKFANSSTRSKEAALRAELRLLRNAVELFKNDTGCYPTSLSHMTVEAGSASVPATGKDSAGNDKAIVAADFRGPYVSTISKDPISGNAFTYSTTAGTVGKITAPTGTASDGTNYNTW